MKKVLAFLFSIFIFFSCQEVTEQKDKNEEVITESSISVGGSETELHLVKDLISSFNNGNNINDFKISGGGSKIGLEQLFNEEITIANSSIPVSVNKRKKITESGFELKEIVFALDAVAVITNSKLGVDSLSNFEIQKIYTGEITNWKEVGGPDQKIILYGRDENSGTNDFFWKKIVQKDYGQDLIKVSNNEEMLQSIQNNIGGIGYLGVGNIMTPEGKPSDKIWAVNIYVEGGESFSPYEVSAIRSGNYYLTRPLYQYFFKKNFDKLDSFIEFELSEAGQDFIRKSGFFPITENFEIHNQQQGFSKVIHQ